MTTEPASLAPATTTPVAGNDSIRLVGYLAFVLIGWGGLLVPALIRSVEHDFSQTDAGLGIWYFVSALFWAAGGVGAGFLTEHVGRRVTLPLAALSLGLGLAVLALAPSWPVFLFAAAPLSLGAGGLDAGVNGLFLDLHPGQGGALSLLHFFFSIGALAAPFVVGVAVDSGVPWRLVPLASGAAAIVVGAALYWARPASGKRTRHGDVANAASAIPLLGIPLLLLAIAIGCYVAAEIGTSNWLVRFLAAAPLTLATATLSLFWAGLAAGRLLASRVADRFDPVAFATACAILAGIAGLVAVLAPNLPLAMLAFAVAGLGQGPIYPMIMTIGGTLQPARSGAVSGLLTGAAVIGGLIYPPVIGFISVSAGIAVGLIGAALLALGAAVALVVSHLLRPARP